MLLTIYLISLGNKVVVSMFFEKIVCNFISFYIWLFSIFLFFFFKDLFISLKFLNEKSVKVLFEQFKKIPFLPICCLRLSFGTCFHKIFVFMFQTKCCFWSLLLVCWLLLFFLFLFIFLSKVLGIWCTFWCYKLIFIL